MDKEDYNERMTYIRFNWWFIALAFVAGLVVGLMV